MHGKQNLCHASRPQFFSHHMLLSHCSRYSRGGRDYYFFPFVLRHQKYAWQRFIVCRAFWLHNRKRVLRQQLKAVGEDSNPVGEGFPNRVSEFLLGKSRWRFK
jgi:hypothetical protein